MVILSGLPPLQDLIEGAPLEERAMRMAEISNTLVEHLKGKTLEFIEANKTRLRFYGVLTAASLGLDSCLLLYNAGRSAVLGMEAAEFVRVAGALSLLWIDLYYYLWPHSLKFLANSYVSDTISKALRGDVEPAREFLLKRLKKEIDDEQNEVEEPVALKAS